MNVEIKGEQLLKFSAQGISYVLDCLAMRPFKEVNGLINDLIVQLRTKNGESDGKTGLPGGASSGGNPSDGAGGLPSMEAQSPDSGA